MFDPSKLEGLINQFQNTFKDMNLNENINEITKKAKDTTHTIKSGGNMINLSINGAGEVIDLNIDDSLLSADSKEELQILLIGAINDAFKAVLQNQKKMALDMLGNFNS